MKKLIIILTVLALVLSLFAGCGGSKDDGISGSISQNAPADTPDTPDEEEAEFDTGVVIGGTYSNEFLGVNLTLDSNWVFFSEEQIAELNGATADLITDEDIKEMMESSGVVYDLYATTLDTSCSINLVIENLGLLYGTVLSEESYVDASIGTLATTLESAGMSNVVCEKTSVEFCGKTHTAISVSGINPYGIEVYETLVCYKVGSYMACFTFVALDKETSLGLIDLFYTGEPVYNEAPAEPAEPIAPAAPSQPAESADPTEFSVGTIDGNSFVSNYLGIKCELDNSWYMYTTADIAAYNGLSSDSHSTQDALDLFAAGNIFYDMSAESYDGNFSMELLWEDLGPIYGATLSAQDYIDMTYSSVEESYVASGFDTVDSEKVFVDFCGQQHPAVVIHAAMQGVEIHQTMICIKQGNYIALVGLLSIGADCTETLAGYFSPIN